MEREIWRPSNWSGSAIADMLKFLPPRTGMNCNMELAMMDEALDTSAAARFVGLSPSYMCRLRVLGVGPEFHKLGRRVVYQRGALEAYLAAHRRNSTAEAGRLSEQDEVT